MSDLAVITCFFNPARYNRSQANLHRWQRQMMSLGVRISAVEGCYPGQPSITHHWPGWHQVEISNRGVLFQKEALLNLAAKRANRPYIVWMDCDVWIDNPDWPNLVPSILDMVPAMQPFMVANWTDVDGSVCYSLPSSAFVKSSHPLKGHPGFAFAARAELWSELGGLYPYCVIGQGDVAIATALIGQGRTPDQILGLGQNEAGWGCYNEWAAKVTAWTGGRVAASRGAIWHEWHGSRSDRRYVDRHAAIKGINPQRDLQLTPEGWLEWSSAADPEMISAVADYFGQRKEDG